MPVIDLTIPGEARGLARPRITTRCGHPRNVDDPKNINEKGRLQVFIRDEMQRLGIVGPVAASPLGFTLSVGVFYHCPQSMSKRTREAALKGAMRVTRKPDCDNLLKMIGDAWNGILWADDAQITTMHIYKQYAERDYMRVVVTWEDAK